MRRATAASSAARASAEGGPWPKASMTRPSIPVNTAWSTPKADKPVK